VQIRAEVESNYDLMTLIMVNRGGNPEEKGIFEYLESVFRADIKTMREYSDVEWNESIQREVANMTGLSDYYFERGQLKGEAIGMEKSIDMLIKLGYDEEQIIKSVSEEFDVSEETVREILGMKVG